MWYAVWDEKGAADRSFSALGRTRGTGRKGYRATIERLELEGKPATRYVLAPSGWGGMVQLAASFRGSITDTPVVDARGVFAGES